MKRRKKRGLSGYMFILGAISVLTVGCFILTLQSSDAAETTGIPPIDQAVPSIIKTASFGLG